jgi:hypothetical protein
MILSYILPAPRTDENASMRTTVIAISHYIKIAIVFHFHQFLYATYTMNE